MKKWQHAANEWADAATNGMQWMKNIRDGISTAEEAIAALQRDFDHARSEQPELCVVPLSEQKIAEAVFGVLRTYASDPLWKALTYDSGYHEVTTLRGVAVDIARAIEREHGICAPNARGNAPDTARTE